MTGRLVFETALARRLLKRRALGRRLAILLPVGLLGSCSLFDDIFSTNKTPMPGRREGIMLSHRGLQVASGQPASVVLPPAVAVVDWPQAGGNAQHLVGRVSGPARLGVAWKSSIGEGGGYRRKITSAPVVMGGRVLTMDSDGLVSAFDAAGGRQAWEFDTQGESDRSTNVGGGAAVDGGVVYVASGRAELLALDAASGKLKWRVPLGAPARSSPTIAEGRVFLTTIAQQLLAFDSQDGKRIWSFQGASADTSVLGNAAPAYADGLVVAGFGSGDLVAVRAATGGVAWTDGIAAAAGRTSLADLSAITGMPVIADQRVFAVGLGGLMVALDLRAGRRLWEREVAGGETPCVAGDWIFLVTADQQIAAIGAADGLVSWVAELPRYKNVEKQSDPIQWKGPLLIGDQLLVVGTHGKARLLSPFTGATRSEIDLADAASLAPIVAGGMVFVVTDDGTLSALH